LAGETIRQDRAQYSIIRASRAKRNRVKSLVEWSRAENWSLNGTVWSRLVANRAEGAEQRRVWQSGGEIGAKLERFDGRVGEG
jgi:hypothetical protein